MLKKNSRLYTDYVNEYLESGTIFGYLGHENRTEKTDIILEDVLKNKEGLVEDLYDLVGKWICSRHARHVMDEITTTMAFQFYLDNHLEEILNVGREIS